MAIPEKNINESSQVKVELYGEIKKAVMIKRDELRTQGNGSKELAIQKIIREWIELKGLIL